MKKNRMMRAASALLVAVLMTTCTISGTFAKYVTEGSAGDTARVAKFGVTVTATGNAAMFSDTYATDLVTAAKDSSDNDLATTVAATTKVVAPVTEIENATTFTIEGTPEVAVNVAYTGTLDEGKAVALSGWVGDYCPLVFTINTAEIKQTGTVAEFETALNNAIKKSVNYEPGTPLASTEDLSVSWAWPFEGDNVKDTALGDAASATVSIGVKCTVTQID